jgi:hypothetical protein
MQYEHTQLIGYRPLGFAIISTGLGALVMALVGAPAQAVGVMIAAVVGTAVLFGSLTVRVTDDTLIWYFGPRFWRNTLAIDAIEHVEPVQNSWMHGWGIQQIEGPWPPLLFAILQGGTQQIGGEWLYNVGGFDAVKIETTDGAVVRIGTDEPERLADVLASRAPNATP